MFITRRRRRSGVTAISPSTLFAASEQGGWWDPSDFSTMFQDMAGLTPVTAAGQTVGRINDKSGRGNHLTNKFTGGPILTQDAGGKYYLAAIGSGASRLSSVGAFDMSGSDKLFLCWGNYKDVASGIPLLVETGIGASGFDSAGILGAFGIGGSTPILGCMLLGMSGGTNPPVLTKNTTGNSRGFLLVTTTISDIGAGTLDLRNNAVVESTASSGSVSTGNFSATNSLHVNSRGDTGNFFSGRWYGGIIRGGASSAAQISVAEAYINSKMGAF